MKINHIYNKSVTCREEGEVVAERYNGSNAKFAIFKTIELAANTTTRITFSELKNFEYIDWGDKSTVDLGPSEGVASHDYTLIDENKSFVIVVMGVDNFGEGKTGKDDSYDIFRGDYIQEAYFGEGTKIWAKEDSVRGFSRAYSLTTVRNLAQCPISFFYQDKDDSSFKTIQKLSFNIDCTIIKKYGLANTRYDFEFLEIPEYITTLEEGALYGIDSTKEAETVDNKYKISIVLPKSIKNIGKEALASNYIECIYYKGNVADYNKIQSASDYKKASTVLYYYSETEPTEVGNYWHYVDSKPTAWEVT